MHLAILGERIKKRNHLYKTLHCGHLRVWHMAL